MDQNLLHLALEKGVILERLLKALQSKDLEENELTEETDLIELNLNNIAKNFPEFFVKYIRSQIKWLIKPHTTAASDEASNKLIPRTPDQKNISSFNLSGIGSPSESFESCNKSQQQKSRGILKVNVSSTHSPNDSRFNCSTPLKLAQNSAGPCCTPGSSHLSPGESPVSNSSPFLQLNVRSLKFPNDSPMSKAKLSWDEHNVPASSKKGKGRRIKPTQVTSVEDVEEDEDENGGGKDNVFMSAPELAVGVKPDRLLLKEECEALQKEMSALTTSVQSPPYSREPLPSPDSSRSTSPVNCGFSIAADADSPRKLEILALIYSVILRENLCPNLMVELNFLITLAAQRNLEKEYSKDELLGSACNCIQLAVLTLWNVKEMIVLLSPAVLNLLSVTPGVVTFSSALEATLIEAYREKYIKSSLGSHVPTGGNIVFHFDTTDIEHFACHFDFTSFQKQKEEFYILLHKWQANPYMSSWSARVKNILSMNEEASNMLYFVELFRNQLLISCSSYHSTVDDPENSLLQLLPSADKGKLSRLTARFTGPAVRGPVPKPGFHGQEVFFKNFIESSGASNFMPLVKMDLLQQLEALNKSNFIEINNDCFADEWTQKRYLECLTSTRLLAKFFAFMEFLPYRSSSRDEVPEDMILYHLSTLEKTIPLFNAEKLLRDAIESRRLILTVPWLVSYMGLIDEMSARWSVYMKVWALLAGLRKNLPANISPSGKLLLQLNLGWLFEVAPIPEVAPVELEPASCENGLDVLPLVTESALYAACPYLTELDYVLAECAAGTPRHIRPTPQPMSEAEALRLQELRFERKFLKSQTTTIRHLMRFVVERVAAICVWRLKTHVLLQVKECVREETTRKYGCDIQQSNKEEIMEFAVTEWETQVKIFTTASIRDICTPNTRIPLRIIIGPNADELTTQKACDLYLKKTIKKVNAWIEANILNDHGRMEARTALETQLFPAGEEEDEANLKGKAPVYLSESIFRLQRASLQAIQGCLASEVLSETVRVTVAAVGKGIESFLVERQVICLVADLLLFIYIRNSELIPLCSSITALLHKLRINTHPDGPLSRTLSPRTLELINHDQECLGLVQLLKVFIQETLLTMDEIKEQITKSLELKCPEELQLRLYKIVNIVLDNVIDDNEFISHTKLSMLVISD